VLHQQRQVQTQRTQEWLQLAQKTQVAFNRLQNLFSHDFNFEIYDTVLASAPPDPAFTTGRQGVQTIYTIPEMREAFANGENGFIVDGGVFFGAHDRYYGRNMEGHYSSWSGMIPAMMTLKLPYMRMFRKSLLETMAADPSAPLARHFRMFVEHRLMPAMAEVAELLHESGTLLEWPTAEEMAALFPLMTPGTSREMLMFLFRSYYQSWCALCDFPSMHGIRQA
jgi:hypothetical protein